MSMRIVRRSAPAVAGAALGLMALIGLTPAGTADSGFTPLTPPTTSGVPSYAPANPVDCIDPNNAVNCQSPPIDSPLVVGTADPGSPYRD